LARFFAGEFFAVKYVSTRGSAPVLEFEDVLLTGLARDGGLYVPENWPQWSADDIRDLAGLSYPEIATRVIAPFIPSIPPAQLAEMISGAYASFSTPDVAPLSKLEDGHWLLELYHGPTLAFKDVAMQLIGRLFDHVLSKRRQHVTIVGATSGDTGSAAIEACRDRDAIDIFVLYPHGRVSEIQRRQMTTVSSANVHAIAIEGNFDDCQNLLKAMFNDLEFRDRIALSAVNSINWGRVVSQIVYYFTAALQLGAPDKTVSFSVPTGNFGDIFAGYAARQMGLPIEKLVIATNENDLLHRFFETGSYKPGQVVATQSPSMDIQLSSNFERLVFDMVGRDGAKVAGLMADLAADGSFSISDTDLAAARAQFMSCRVDEATAAATIAQVWQQHNVLLDPHTAIGVHAARQAMDQVPMVTLSTAHPAKFPDAVEKASGQHPPLPPHMADIMTRPERVDVLANDLSTVQAHILSKLKAS